MKDHLDDAYNNSIKKIRDMESEWKAFKAAVEGTYKLSIAEQIRDIFTARIWKYLLARDEGYNRREAFKGLFMPRDKFLEKFCGPKQN
jgi:hypothetical protein